MILSVCIVGINNEPLYFYYNPIKSNKDTYTESDDILGSHGKNDYFHMQMVSHSCLDLIFEKKNR